MSELLQQVPEVTDIDPPRKEAFLNRWSRVKREVKAGAVPPGTVEVPADKPVLPSLEALVAQGLEADFTPFMQQGVEAATKRAAIQQLFKQPVFNVMDGLDVYIEDFNIYEPLTAAELPGLAHARGLLFPELDEAEKEQVATVAEIKQETQAEVPASLGEENMSKEESNGRG